VVRALQVFGVWLLHECQVLVIDGEEEHLGILTVIAKGSVQTLGRSDESEHVGVELLLLISNISEEAQGVKQSNELLLI
jgi:hypothetical protein